MKIGIIQMDVERGEPDINYKKVSTMVEIIMGETIKPDVIILPELWTTGYALDQMKEVASTEGKEPAEFLGKLSKKYGVWFVGGSVLARNSSGYFNRAQVINADGDLVASYDKIHLFSLMNEDKYFSKGNEITIFDIKGVSSSCVICYDIRFCELIRKIALLRVKLLFVSAEWPHPRLDHWQTLLKARAIENQMYIVACNRVGKSDGNVFFGNSMVIDPWGEIILRISEEKEKAITINIDLSVIERVRTQIPIFKDRRPEIYY